MNEWIGKLIIVNDRLMGRFNSNKEIIVAKSRFKLLALIKTKLMAVYYDWFVVDLGNAIYFKVYKAKDE